MSQAGRLPGDQEVAESGDGTRKHRSAARRNQAPESSGRSFENSKSQASVFAVTASRHVSNEAGHALSVTRRAAGLRLGLYP